MSEKVKVIGYCDVGVELNKKSGKPYSRVLLPNGVTVHLSEFIEPKSIVNISYDYDIISQRVIFEVDSILVVNVELIDYLQLITDTIQNYYNLNF